MPQFLTTIITSQAFITAMVATIIICLLETAVIRKAVKDTLTGPDNETYDFAKLGGLSGMLTLFTAELWHLMDDNVFDPIQFATAFATVLSAACAGIWLKSKGNDMPVVK